MKIDTQGMSFGDGKDSSRSLKEQRDAIPPMEVNKMNLLSDSLKVELKELINEVLDERAWSHIPSVEMLDSINITGNIDLK